MTASRYWLLRVAVLGWFLRLAAGCGDAGRFGPSGLAPKGDGAAAKPLGEKLRPTTAAARQLEVSPEDALKSSAALVKRARAASRELQRISERVTISPALEAAAAELPERRTALSKRVAVATQGIRHSRRGAWVRDIRYSFVEDKKQIDALQAKVEEVS